MSDPLFDLEFALNQLSGNREILEKLLNKFISEHTNTVSTLPPMVDDDIEQAQRFVHTVKGVTGNLGINALHAVSKQLENELKAGGADSLDAFTRCLTQTLAALKAETGGDAPIAPPADNDSALSQEDACAELIAALRANEFIPDDHLSSLLAPLPHSDQSKRAIQQAVYELDYDKALSLLER